jgi:uncharacterized membrane protein
MKSILMLWVTTCHIIFQTFPNVLLLKWVNAISDKIVNAIWPLDPNNACMYGNFQNLIKELYFNAILQSVVICLEILLIALFVSKIKRYYGGCSSWNHKFLNRLHIRKHFGKYVGISLLALILGQVAYLKYSEISFVVKPEDKQTQEKYLKMYVLINSGDKAETNMHTEEAKKYYQEAYLGLLQIQKEKPDWEPTIVRYRLRYVREKLGIPNLDK